jgi:excinuclease ABC subunit A
VETNILVRGAREHNLKDISVKIPRNKFTVITGLSGSGKSTLAFDTLYAEGQRRYLESLSSYARQFLERLKKPDVDHISGLSPSIAIEQRSISHNPRSTVATTTEIYDYLRLLYAKLSTVYCPKCHRQVKKQTRPLIFDQVKSLALEKKIEITAPLVRGRKGEYRKLIEEIKKKGFLHVRVDGNDFDIQKSFKISKNIRHDIDVIIDLTHFKKENAGRVRRSLGTALDLADGLCSVRLLSESGSKNICEHFFSEKMACAFCQISFRDFTPNMFSFNSPYGACERCRGIGKLSQVTSNKIICQPEKALLKGALNPDIFFSFNQYVIEDLVYELKSHFRFDLSVPYKQLPDEVKEALLWGVDDITGLIEELENLYYATSSQEVKRKVRRFVKEGECPACDGMRLKKESLGVKISGENIVELCAKSIDQVSVFIESLRFEGRNAKIAAPIVKEIKERLRFLENVGLNYLTLDRPVNTLAGGELQRIRLAAQIGVGLTGVLYVLDEPSVGLHPKDNEKLLGTLKKLKEMKNTVIVVEHDEETMRQADYIVDLGPGAGRSGGEVVATGRADELAHFDRSLTARYLTRRNVIQLPKLRKDYKKTKSINLKGCKEHNLKNIDVKFPLGCFIGVTGVSGSGKSTLVHDILFRALHNHLWRTDYRVGKFRSVKNIHLIDKVIEIDQKPIGRTPRSNAATYTDLFTHVRRMFAETQESRVRNFSPSRFSFNVKGGRCEICRGEGYQRLEMSFLPDVYVLCEACFGKRYNEATLRVRYRNKTISEVLEMSIQDAVTFFDSIPAVYSRLKILKEIGLGYLKLGQPSTTLSGGEAQRVKLGSELNKKATGRTFYILDEPTTGLHFADIENLVKAIFRLRDGGNTVLVVEHNLELIKQADYIIDLGPLGGELGGELVGAGSPEELVKIKRSYTGQYLQSYLQD